MKKQYQMSEKAKSYWYAQQWVTLFVVIPILVLMYIFLDDFFGSYEWVIKSILICVGIYIVLELFIVPVLKYRHYGWKLTNESIQYFTGIYVKERTMVPIVRIQYVTTSEGPLLKYFGLKNVMIATAGGSHIIQALKKEEAEKLIHELNVWIEERVKEEKQHDSK